jgi:hypothetical protein
MQSLFDDLEVYLNAIKSEPFSQFEGRNWYFTEDGKLALPIYMARNAAEKHKYVGTLIVDDKNLQRWFARYSQYQKDSILEEAA